MNTHERQLVSKCCEATTHFMPPSLGEEGCYFCSKCNTECEIEIKEIQTHIIISKGVYRPIQNIVK